MILSTSNFLDQLQTTQFTYLSANVDSGGTALGVKNINSFQNQWAIQIGKTGEAQSEIQIISGAPAGTSINTVGTLLYGHNIDTPLYQIHYDEVIFKRSTTGTLGTASPIGTIPITPNSFYTEFNDSSGSTTYAYKTQFYNSISGDTSLESDWFIPGGPTFYSLQSMRQRGKDALHNANFIKSDGIIGDWINEWVEQMTNAAIKVNQGYSMGTTSIAFGTAGFGTVTLSNFKQANKIEVTWDGTNYVNSREIPVDRFEDSDTFLTDSPVHYWVGDTVFGVRPLSSGGTARITYSMLTTPLVNDSDELPLSLRSYTTSCIEYMLYRAYGNDLKDDIADRHYQKFLKLQQDFIHEVTPRDLSGPKFIDFTDSLSGAEDMINLVSDFIS